MNILFLHPNFPAQFRHLATVLAKDPKNRVIFLTKRENGRIPGVQKLLYSPSRQVNPKTHRYVQNLEEAVLEGQAAWRTARTLKQQGFQPQVIYAHSGWGPGLFMKDLFPEAEYCCYFEWFYHAQGTDADFDPNDPLDDDDIARIRVKNSPILLDLVSCDRGLVPTKWQQQQFPSEFHSKLTVLHDGIDTTFFHPQPNARLVLPAQSHAKKGFKPAQLEELSPIALAQQHVKQQGLDLSGIDEIVTYVARGMEPYRGFPQFMEAVALLQEQRPHCHVVVVGEDRVAYGKKLTNGKTYGQQLLEELKLDLSRLHFVGWLPYEQYLQVLQASSVHIYLTRPFVLSWSLLEAMATGCVVVASRTPPVEEVILDGINGFLVDFFSPAEIAAKVSEILQNPQAVEGVRQQARATVIKHYEMSQLMLQHLQFIGYVQETQ